MTGKISFKGMIPYICIIVFVLMGIFLPKTGELVLLDEICDTAIIWIVCLCVVSFVFKRENGGGNKNVVKCILVCVCAVFLCAWSVKAPLLDMISGSTYSVLSDIKVSKSMTHAGVISLHYYLSGYNSQGEFVRVEISGGDYTHLSGRENVSLEYYRHTRRVLKLYS